MREGERKAVDETARLHPNDWSSLEVRLIDCSEAGFRAQCDARISKYDRITLELPGIGPVEAVVAWSRGREFGARFDAPIPLDRARLTPANDQQVLARLLVQRAAAREARLREHEHRLQEEIARNLPVRPD